MYKRQVKHRSLDIFTLRRPPAGVRDFIGVGLGAHYTYIVRGHKRVNRGETDREILATVEVLRCGMRPHRNHDLIHVPLAAPGSVHRVRTPIGIVCADNQHRLRKHPRLGFEILHITDIFR